MLRFHPANRLLLWDTLLGAAAMAYILAFLVALGAALDRLAY